MNNCFSYFSDILSEIKIHIRSDGIHECSISSVVTSLYFLFASVEVRRNLGMPSVEPPSNVYRSVPRRQTPSRLNSFTEGKRLGELGRHFYLFSYLIHQQILQ